MKTKNLIRKNLWVVLLLAPVLAFAQQRRVDWIHGLGGDAGSWQNVNDTYQGQGRQIIQNSRLQYNTSNGIQGFANQIIASPTGGGNTISISHSMGGTAVRQVDIDISNYWVGNITAGSPLRGGQIAVSATNGVSQQFIQRGVVELMRGPSVGSTALFIISPVIGILLVVGGILGTSYSNTIATLAVNAIINSLGLSGQTVNDLNPNGTYMNNVVNQGTGSPKINVWGNEDNPVLWRLAGSYAGGSDQSGVDLVNQAAGIYHTAADVEYTTSWIPPFIIFHGYWTWRGDQWMAGADWLRHTSNAGWQAVIGSGYEQHQNVWVPVYDFTCMEQNMQCDPQNPNSCEQSECLDYQLWDIITYVVDPSDGVVPGRSARNDGGAWRGHIVEAPGTNHKELLQYNEAHNTYDRIFNGNEIGGQNIFRIGF